MANNSNSNDAKTFMRDGIVLLKSEKYEEAIKAFDNAIELDPSDANAYLDKGIALTNINLSKKAIKCFEIAIGLNPNNVSPYYFRHC